MSPELETLDQLLGGALALAIIRGCYPDHDRFVRGVSGLSPGTYWLRLRQGGQAAVRTVVVVR